MVTTSKSTGKGKDVSQKITPFLWFDNQAEEAANFYVSVFENSEITKTIRYDEAGARAAGRPVGSVMTIAFRLDNVEFVGLNGGPAFNINSSISFYVYCSTKEEMDTLWKKLSKEGKPLMKLDTYPFSEKYGWIQDKYGVSWQLILGKGERKISPCLLYSGDQQGRAEEAINFYVSVFRDSEIHVNVHYDPKLINIDAKVVHAEFSLCGEPFIAMDSGVLMPDVNFSEAVSLVINCENQREVDHYWEALTMGGDESAQQCGWLKDKFGMSWQVVPTTLQQLLIDPDPAKTQRVMMAMLSMKKIDVGQLQEAYAG